MSLRARTFLGLVLCAALAGAAPTPASADVAAPVIVPAWDATGIANGPERPCGDSRFPPPTGWRTCLLPSSNATVDWPAPGGDIWDDNKNFILPSPGTNALWLGESRTEAGYPLIWRDVGSGFPVAPASGAYEFPLAGKYFWECDSPDRCVGSIYFKLKGTMYVIGPRAIINYSRVASGPGDSITYGLDASGSFVTDYTAEHIVEYAFDFQDDGVFDQVSPEPTAQYTFVPGGHTVRIRVKDTKGRIGVYPFFFQVPYIRAGNPEPNPIADNGPGTLNPTGVKFAKTNIKLKAVKRIRVTVLRRKGLSVKVSGLTKGDRIRARLLKGKRSVVASGAATATASTKTVRLRVGRAGKRTLRAKPRPKRLVLDVAVEGTDGFQTTKRVAVRISS